MLKIKDVARIFEVPPGTIRRWCQQGKIKVYRVGSRGTRKFRHEDIAIAYIDMTIQKCFAVLTASY